MKFKLGNLTRVFVIGLWQFKKAKSTLEHYSLRHKTSNSFPVLPIFTKIYNAA